MANLKTKNLQTKLTPAKFEAIRKAAEDRNMKTPEFVNEALDFYGAFDVGFLDQMQITAGKLDLQIPRVIENLLQTYIATDSAISETFKTQAHTFKRAFQYDERGLIKGSRLSNKVYKDQKKTAQDLLKRLKEASEQGTETFISKQDAGLLTAILGSNQESQMAP
jgi:hypothetical protein